MLLLNKIVKLHIQGHPVDLFVKMPVLQANFCWLRELEEFICSRKESVAGKSTIQSV